jgi:hypothetical protein
MPINLVVCGVFVVLLGISAIGVFLQRGLKVRHRNLETVEAVRLVISIPATFTEVRRAAHRRSCIDEQGAAGKAIVSCAIIGAIHTPDVEGRDTRKLLKDCGV